MKLTFLGVAGFLSEGFQSNMLFDTDNSKTLLLDCGTDIKHSLKAANREVSEIDAVYISHLHGDHMGGLEWLAFYSYFVTKKRIDLYIHESLFNDLWSMLRPALSNHKGKYMAIYDYFNVKTFRDSRVSFVFDKFSFRARKLCHVNGQYWNMYSYALLMDDNQTLNTGQALLYISFDTEEIKITDAKYIFYDCDVMNLSGVHPNYNELKKIGGNLMKRIWLYHYTDLSKYNGEYGEMPDAVADGFAGFVKEGQIFELEHTSPLKDYRGPDLNDFKPGILEEEDKHLEWGGSHPDAFGSPGFIETEVKKDETIYELNNKDKPFSGEGLEQKRHKVNTKRKDGLQGKDLL